MKALPLLAVVLVAALPAAGCGADDDPISGSDAPAITSPGTTLPYETGGADGSGSDGRKADDDRGGTAGGRDSGSGG